MSRNYLVKEYGGRMLWVKGAAPGIEGTEEGET